MAIQLRASNCKPFVRVDLHLSHHHYVVSTIERRRRIIVIEIHRFESWQAVKMVFCPVPDVTKHIIKPHGGRRVHVDRLCVCVRACVCVEGRETAWYTLFAHACTRITKNLGNRKLLSAFLFCICFDTSFNIMMSLQKQ